MSLSLSLRGLLCLSLISLALPAMATAAVSARYVRVENPTAMYMEWAEVQVFSGGTNIVEHHPECIKGAHWYDVALQNYSDAMLDGKTEVDKRGTDYANGLGNKIDVWFELDLGKLTPIDEIKLYGGSYPNRKFGDKGNRLITLLDENRKVLWAAKWDYFDSKTPPAVAEGTFTFSPVPATPEPGGPIGMTVPPTDHCLEWSPLVWLLGTTKQPPPPDAVQRLARFKARNTTGLTAFADHFFDLIEPDVVDLAEARALHAQGKDEAALESWKKYWFAKISRMTLGSATTGGSTDGSYHGIGDDLANNVRLDLTGSTARMVKFVPGVIDWLDPAMGTDNKYVEKFPCGLLEAFRDTGNPKYVTSWAEIMDDWSTNYFAQADTSATNVKNLFVFCEVDAWMGLLGKINSVARERPELLTLIPATTLARMQVACLEQYGPAYWRPVHDMLFGHASSAIALWRSSLDTFDEFGPGRRIAKEWREHFERWMTMCTAPDGLMVGNEDEAHMIIPFQLGASIAVFEKNPPAWYTPGVRNRTLAWLDNAHKDIFRHPAPGGYDHRYGEHGISWDRFVDLVKPYGKNGFDRSDVIYAIPEVRRILGAICAVDEPRPEASATAPAWQNKLVEVRQKMYDGAVKVLGTEKPGKPLITSDWMPYGGSYYFRSGWGYNDAFVSMLARTTHGGLMPTSCGQFVHYDYFFPLMRGEAEKINGLDRLANTAFPRFWTKHCQVDLHAENIPEPFRWHSSPAFAVGENEFTGRFQNEPDHKGIEQVHEVRQVMQLRGARLFIITDSTSFPAPSEAKNSHDFSIDFTPALSHLKDSKTPYSHDQLKLDADAKTIKTFNPDGPNDALYQFTSATMQYNPSWAEPTVNSYSARFSGEYAIAEPVVGAHWSVTGNTALVSVISSSEAGAKERIASIESLNKGQGISGFHATLREGGDVWYQATATGVESLTCGAFTAQAKNLLVYRDAQATFHGIALDCTTLAVDGKALTLPGVDCEFTVTKGQLTKTEIIYRPIDPVRFTPESNAFTGSQLVTMTSDTPNVEIRYTTDGTQPTTASKLYSKPFTITATTEIAARAYRLVAGKYLDFNDFEINGTKFTEPTYGWFYQKPLQDPVVVADPAALQPGLTSEYLEGTWNVLYSDSHWLRPTAISTVPKEMDLSPAYNTNYYYGMRYKGYVKIPTDGVYTFIAPTELTSMSCSASYDYRVYVDGAEWNLTQWFHGRSTWSVALKAGLHSFQLDFANGRIRPWRNAGLWVYGDYPSAWVEHQGPPSPLLISGPGLDHQPIPTAWFFRNPADAKLATVTLGAGPTATTAHAASYTQINLAWQYAGTGHSGFRIERAVDGTPFSLLATVGPAVTSYQDTAGLSMSTTFNYRIRAFNAHGESAYSNEAHVSTGGSTGTGLHGDYYSGLEFNELKKSRLDGVIDFEWTNQGPDPVLGLTNYTVRWTGKVQTTTSEPYTFYTSSDDGVRLWVNGKLLIDKWVTQGGNEWSGTIDLSAAAMNDIKLEYFQAGGGAMVKLSWSSPSRPKELIPQTQLYPASAVPTKSK